MLLLGVVVEAAEQGFEGDCSSFSLGAGERYASHYDSLHCSFQLRTSGHRLSKLSVISTNRLLNADARLSNPGPCILNL